MYFVAAVRTSFLRPHVEVFPSAREKYFSYVWELYSVLILTVQRYNFFLRLQNIYVSIFSKTNIFLDILGVGYRIQNTVLLCEGKMRFKILLYYIYYNIYNIIIFNSIVFFLVCISSLNKLYSVFLYPISFFLYKIIYYCFVLWIFFRIFALRNIWWFL